MTTEEVEHIYLKLRTTRTRLGQVAFAQGQDVPGFEQILAGLADVLASFEERTPPEMDPSEVTRLMVLVQGLSAIADFFEPIEITRELPAQARPEKEDGLKQFFDGFRQEARKRLSGLSISMMGVFNPALNPRALEQSASHLHAVRGSASMLNLTSISALCGLMEHVMVSMQRLEPSQREWPIKGLMRGYYLLEQAVESSDLELNPQACREVMSDLQGGLDEIASSPENRDDDDTLPPVSSPKPSAQPSGRRDRRMTPLVISAVPGHPPQLNPEDLEQRILIVDDMETIAASVGFILSELDVPIDIATDGESALRMVRQRPYSLVISDIAMPKMDGIALTKTIRQDARLASIPIILLTHLDHPTERQVGLTAGASDYIIKGSIGGGELLAKVRDLLKIAPFVPTDAAHLNAHHRVLIAEDAETVAASIAFVLAEGPFHITLAVDGRDALNRLARGTFDLVITDAQMPQLTGFELIEAIRATPAWENLPVVLLTSEDSDETRQQAHRVGADRFLIKGKVGAEKLLEVVLDLLEDGDDEP